MISVSVQVKSIQPSNEVRHDNRKKRNLKREEIRWTVSCWDSTADSTILFGFEGYIYEENRFSIG